MAACRRFTAGAVLLALLTTSDGADVLSSNKDAWLREHNNRRCQHGSPALTWSDAAALSMKRTFDQYGCEMVHRTQPQGDHYGENLAWSSGGVMSPADVLTLWYDKEKVGYNYATNDIDWNRGHFQQVVWFSSSKVGCAVCGTTIGCRYDPAGNVQGQYTNNIPRDGKSCSGSGGGSTTPPPTGNLVASRITSGGQKMCLDWWGYGAGGQLRLYSCAGQWGGGDKNHQVFNRGWYGSTMVIYFKDAYGNYMCIDSLRDSVQRGNPVAFWYCNGNRRQAIGEWNGRLYNSQSGYMCINVPGGNAANGVGLIWWDCSWSAANEVWDWTQTTGGFRMLDMNASDAEAPIENITDAVLTQLSASTFPDVAGPSDSAAAAIPTAEPAPIWPWAVGVAISSCVALVASVAAAVLFVQRKPQKDDPALQEFSMDEVIAEAPKNQLVGACPPATPAQ